MVIGLNDQLKATTLYIQHLNSLQLANAILIYPVPLFIGLETDAVIYIRNKYDASQTFIGHREYLRDTLHKVRAAHHFLAISRAKYQLIDVLVE